MACLLVSPFMCTFLAHFKQFNIHLPRTICIILFYEGHQTGTFELIFYVCISNAMLHLRLIIIVPKSVCYKTDYINWMLVCLISYIKSLAMGEMEETIHYASSRLTINLSI